jgi:hypothetical protein
MGCRKWSGGNPATTRGAYPNGALNRLTARSDDSIDPGQRPQHRRTNSGKGSKQRSEEKNSGQQQHLNLRKQLELRLCSLFVPICQMKNLAPNLLRDFALNF